jgi:hypothetical protein
MKKILERKVIIEGKNKDWLNIFYLASLNPNSTLVLLENYNDSYEYRLYKKTYPFHVAVINRDYDLLDLKRFDINKKDTNGISIIDYINFLNDPILNKMFT